MRCERQGQSNAASWHLAIDMMHAWQIVCMACYVRTSRFRQRRGEDDEAGQEEIPRPVHAQLQGEPGFIPVRFLILVNLIKRNFPPKRNMHFYNVDAFAGKSAISKAFRHRGRPSVALDLAITPDDESRLNFWACAANPWCMKLLCALQDILSPVGFVRHVRAILAMRPGALLTMGPVCSSWIPINCYSACMGMGCGFVFRAASR